MSRAVIYYEDNDTIITDCLIKTDKTNYILSNYILRDRDNELINDIEMLSKCMTLISGNKKNKYIKNKIETELETNKIVLHINSKKEIEDLRIQTKIDKKSKSYKYVIKNLTDDLNQFSINTMFFKTFDDDYNIQKYI